MEISNERREEFLKMYSGGKKPPESEDALYNIFSFQDHLNHWIKLTSAFFAAHDYKLMFEALQNIFADTNGFFSASEYKELEKIYEETHKDYFELIEYEKRYNREKQKNQNLYFNPPNKLYFSAMKFRFKIMRLMAQHQILMKTVTKHKGGAVGK